MSQTGIQRISHPLAPIYDQQSRILILGTMPSPKSREAGFYYGHPQNRFWLVLATLAGQPVPAGNEEKIIFLKTQRIALWDVLESCQIDGADDNSIREPNPNDLERILQTVDIRAIFTTGRKATDLYQRLCWPKTQRSSVYLPSTSPANQAIPTAKLILLYQAIFSENGFAMNSGLD